MNSDTSGHLRVRLQKAGLSDAAIDAAWPDWWSDAAEQSGSARAELRLALSRKLGLDPRSLLEDEDVPRFFWRGAGRFKHLSAESEQQRDAITSFGRAIASLMIGLTPPHETIAGTSALALRSMALDPQTNVVRLVDLLSLCWSAGIPIAHLRVFPLQQKRMAAMTVRIADRSAILLGKDSEYPAHIAFYLAHELGHIALEHVSAGDAIVDLDDTEHASSNDLDSEERQADAFALELLTGHASPQILPKDGHYSSKELARVAQKASAQLQIEAGVIALCFGHATRDWASANAALPLIYGPGKPVWREINAVAAAQMDLADLPHDNRDYLSSVLGLREDA